MSSYETIYEGNPSYLIPRETSLKYLSAGYQSTAGSIGMATDPRTANQLRELNIKMNPGVKHMEVGGIQGAVFDSIPDQHLDEMRRVAKQTGVSLSVHAPIVEASGIGERAGGTGFDEANRISAERQLESALLRSHKMDPKGNISVTVHSTGQLPEMTAYSKVKVKDPETGEEKYEEKLTSVYVVDPNSGRLAPIPVEKKYFPKEGEGEFTGKPIKFNVDEEIEKINKDQWTSQLADINRLSNFGEEAINSVEKAIPKEVFKKLAKSPSEGGVNLDAFSGDDKKFFSEAQRGINHGKLYLRSAYRELKSLFDNTYPKLEGEDKKKLDEFARSIASQLKNGVDEDPQLLRDVVEKGLKVMGDIKNPKTFVKLNDFVVEKAGETFGNVATAAYKKFGDTAPILNIENPPAGSGLSRGEDIKAVVEASRKKFVENLMSEGVSRSEAKEAAEKLIGATWDVGHINMLRKKGYSEKDIIKETEKVAPFVKHVHLSDNFGLEHTELPMGMGNVPMKEIMKRLGEKGFEGKKVIEAGNWWQYFAEQGGGNPFKPSIEAFDSPVYGMKMAPYWSQLGGYAGYYSGQGPINPAVHHKVYGAGFETLPLELGGEMPGDRGRLAGTPNQ